MNEASPRPGLTDLISSYAILPTLATWMSTVDLYNLALTNRTHYSHILGSPTLFKKLRRLCLCDGRGLVKRQNFQRPYYTNRGAGEWTRNSHLYSDEEIEVKLYNAKCDEGGALPCVKCGINVCEECRYYLRARPSYKTRRPHVDSARQISNIMCLCPECDSAVEEEVKGQFLNELCDCDPWARWICTRCKIEESDFDTEYCKKHTLKEFYWGDLGTGENEDPGRRNRERGTANGGEKGDSSDLDEEEDSGSEELGRPSITIIDHAFEVAFWCTCGKALEDDNPIRCTWCRRRHLPEDDWYRDGRDGLPFFDNDPDYPKWTSGSNGHYPNPYPKLGYVREGDVIEETSV
ncbi:unnamed protein product [Clonostachys rosea f. rosea IK726]|uniref:Uncharacterized protein n=1 Tax=Clonostachys rosea f. rosea IK726 TaxID=1349383 RepID=A0ACA9TXP1_BIOOC|nr:unnamed protein product [Clonostachys rosea f. rosea IK726]